MLYNVCGLLIIIVLLIFLCEVEVYVYDIPNLTFLSLNQVYLIWFPVTLRGLRCFEWFVLDDVMLWHVWLDHFGVFDQYYVKILSSFLLITNGYCDTFRLLIEDRWILWLIIWCFQLLMENWCDYYDYLHDAFQFLV